MATLSNGLRDRGIHRLLTATMQGHRKPDLGGAQATFFIHTQSCIYALDEDGICRYVVSADGSKLDHVDRCHGAQYVASLDPRTEQCLVADPTAGAHALFVGPGTGQRTALMKTTAITRVVYADGDTITEMPVRASQLGWVDKSAEMDWARATRVGHVPAVRTATQAGPAPLGSTSKAPLRPLSARKPSAPLSSKVRPRVPRPIFRSSRQG
jgi:hypothetical protein